jgi:hypothetical protein
MHAYKVINDLNQKKRFYYPMDVQHLIGYLEKSQKFHFGMAFDLPLEDIKPDDLWELGRHYWRLPYPVTWFDYVMKGELTGVLVNVGYLCLEEMGIIHMFVFVERPKPRMWYLVCGFKIRPTPDEKRSFDLESLVFPFPMQHDYEMNWHPNELLRLLLILNCKNVKTRVVAPPRKPRTSKTKRKLTQIFEYHTLTVKLSHSGDREVTLGQADSANRIHLCRGHFKQYTADKPLFGKHTGLYFWPAHVRGRNTNGVVMKDYEVETANPE